MPPDLSNLIERIRSDRGQLFEQVVAEAFNSLGLTASLTQSQEAESDVIAEALLPESTYFNVIECCAVDEGNEVGYEKLGQLRGNFMRYLDERRQRLFKNAYKTVVGRPRFSRNSIASAPPDVALITVDRLVELLRFHSKYHFSQDELEDIFKVSGEVSTEHLSSVAYPYQRRISVYALILLALLSEPYSSNDDQRKPYTPVDQVVGSVRTLGGLLEVESTDELEIRTCLRDLQTPFLKLVHAIDEEDPVGEIRLSSLPLPDITATAGELGSEVLEKLREYRQRLGRMRSI